MAITNGPPTTSAISFSKPAKPAKPPPVYYVNNKKVTKKPIGAANRAVFISRMAKLNAIRKKREEGAAKRKKAAKEALEEEKKLFLASNVSPVTKGDMFFVAKTKKKKSLVFVLSQPEPTKTGCIISKKSYYGSSSFRNRFNNYYIPPKGTFNWKMKVLILGGKKPQIKVKVFTTETLLNFEIAGTKTTACPHCNGAGKIREKTNPVSLPLNDMKDKSENELIAEILKMTAGNQAILPDEAASAIVTEPQV